MLFHHEMLKLYDKKSIDFSTHFYHPKQDSRVLFDYVKINGEIIRKINGIIAVETAVEIT